MTKSRWTAYTVLNALMGIPLFTIMLIIMVPLGFMGLFGFEDRMTYENWQLYVTLGYGFFWFFGNALIVKPSGWKGIAVLLGSLVVMSISSSIFGLLMTLIYL